jgi:hypothetical protein
VVGARSVFKVYLGIDSYHLALVVDFSYFLSPRFCCYTSIGMNPDPAAKASSRHELNDTALGKYLIDSETISGLKLPVVSTKIGYGQSNPTYFVDDAAYVGWTLRTQVLDTEY